MTNWTDEEIKKYQDNAEKHYNSATQSADGNYHWHMATSKMYIGRLCKSNPARLEAAIAYCEEMKERFPLV